MKSSKNILDFFKVQCVTVSCPACGIHVAKSKLNIHLDSECSSSIASDAKHDNKVFKMQASSPIKATHKVSLKTERNRELGKPSFKSNSKRSKLSLKQQRINSFKKSSGNKPNLSLKPNSTSEAEVITLDDDSSSSANDLCILNPESKECNNENDSAFQLKDENTIGIVKKDNIPRVVNTEEKNPDVISMDRTKVFSTVQSSKNHSTNVESNEEITTVLLDIKEILPSAVVSLNYRLLTDKKTEKKSPYVASMDGTQVLPNLNIDKKISDIGNQTKTVIDKVHQQSSGYDSKLIIKENEFDNETVQSGDSKFEEALIENNDLNSNDKPQEDLEKTVDLIAVINDAENCGEADNDVFTDELENKQSSQTYSPYYIANFKYILNNVLQDEYNKILFNEEDMQFVNTFENLSDPAQKLYVRMFQRKYNWLKLSKISYPNITNNPASVLEELAAAKLVDSGLDVIDLETALDLLSLPEARTVAKQFNFNLSGKNKTDITQMLLKHCKQHKSVFFCNGKNSAANALLKKVKQVLGHCYRISLLPKRLFTRILMLFSLPTMSEDDDDAAGGQQQQLLTLLQVNKGELIFPDYKVNRQTMIFVERDELIRYEEAKQLENDITNAVESKNFDLAKELCLEAKEEFENQIQCFFVERVSSLPTFLKKYSSFHIYVRCMTQGVEIFQRLRQYEEAVDLLRRLLDQKVFAQDYRGRWMDRLALNLEQHLKQRQQALEEIKKGLKDKNIRVGYRYSLLTRALRILKNVDENNDLKNEILEAANIIEAPKVTIKGRLFPRNVLGRRNVFISSSSTYTEENDITVLGVEQLAIEHYKNEGYTEGIHGESSTFHSLYGLLFWDIMYDGEIPDAFISPYQTHPLDLNHEPFFLRREKQILSHLDTLRALTIEELKEIAKSSWETHFGQTSIVMWDRFTDVDHALGLIGCFGNTILCGICERLARDFRFTRSGVPDLVVWNPETLQVKIVEVKGPGDKLSSKQILWLDYLLKLGADAEVCHIEAVGSKKLRRE